MARRSHLRVPAAFTAHELADLLPMHDAEHQHFVHMYKDSPYRNESVGGVGLYTAIYRGDGVNAGTLAEVLGILLLRLVEDGVVNFDDKDVNSKTAK